MANFGQTGSIPQTPGVIKPRLVSKIYADLTGFDTSNAFNVTGMIACRAYGFVGPTAIQSTSGTTTLSLGVTGSPALLIASATIDNSNFAVNDVWANNTPAELFAARPDTFQIIGVGSNIILTRSVDDITQGVLTIFVEWYPISNNGNLLPNL